MALSPQVIFPAFLCQRYRLLGSLLTLLLKTVSQHDDPWTIEEPEQPERVWPEIDPYLPDILGTNKLLEVLGRNSRQILNQPHDPSHLLGLLAIQGIEELLNGTVASLSSIEPDFSIHAVMLTQM